MKCPEARRHLTDMFDRSGPPSAGLEQHLAGCPDCAQEYAELDAALASIQPVRTVHASPDFKERVMNELPSRISAGPAVSERRRRWFPRWLAVAAVAALIVIAIPVVGTFTRDSRPPLGAGAAVLAQAADALSNLGSVHISAEMRTLPRDNFELIGLDYSMVPLEVRKEFAPVERWRVEKPGRVAVMDGQSAVLFIEPDSAVRGAKDAGFVNWLRPLLDPESILRIEIDAVRAGRARAERTTENGVIVLRVTRAAQGNYDHAWARNKTILQSDHTSVYRIDETTRRLLGLEVVVHTEDGEVPVFRTTEIRYDEAFDPAIFQLVLPQHVTWERDVSDMPVAGPLPQNAREAAVVFLEACATQDWNRMLTVYSFSAVQESMKRKCDGMKVISVGEPFQSGLFPCCFVPYEVRLKGGSMRRWNLAMRNDNSARRWYMNGGF